ncbi:MAG: four helix bundle protein [Nitrospirota bacterium]
MAEKHDKTPKDRLGPIKTFEDLDAWKICRKLRSEIANLVCSFSQHERYRLSDQLIRAARSATANLAEGYGRFHYAENVQFARQARGSLYEVLDHLTVALDEGFIKDDQFQSVREDVIRAVAVVNGYIRYLVAAKSHPRAS